MRAEDFHQHPLQLDKWLLNVTSCRIGDRYLAEVEALDSGVTIARATAEVRENAEALVIEKAADRLAGTRRFDLDLTVGG
jgi:hypothetical protein